MAMYAIKVIITAALVVLVSELAKTKTFLSSLVVSIPWTTFFVILWLRFEKVEVAKITAHAEGVFWLVLPTLPFFLLFPWLLKKGWAFWPGFGASTALMVALYVCMVAVLRKTGLYEGL